jgi:hypothetical protein
MLFLLFEKVCCALLLNRGLLLLGLDDAFDLLQPRLLQLLQDLVRVLGGAPAARREAQASFFTSGIDLGSEFRFKCSEGRLVVMELGHLPYLRYHGQAPRLESVN